MQASTTRPCDNLRVPYVPLHSISACVKYASKVISVSADVQYVSEKYTDFANTRSLVLPGYFLANADFRFSASSNLAFTLAAKNILNVLYYTVSGYNFSGSLRSGLSHAPLLTGDRRERQAVGGGRLAVLM